MEHRRNPNGSHCHARVVATVGTSPLVPRRGTAGPVRAAVGGGGQRNQETLGKAKHTSSLRSWRFDSMTTRTGHMDVQKVRSHTASR